MASPLSTPSLRQLQLVTSSEQPQSTPSTSTSQSAASSIRPMQQRRQSSISYTSPKPNTNEPQPTFSAVHNRRKSVDYGRSSPLSPPPGPRRRPRPLSIAIPNHNRTSISTAPVQIRPQTLTERYAGFLATIAQKEAQVSDLRSQLTAQERELAVLKRQWEKIVRNHLAFPDRDNDSLTGVDGLDKILRGIQSAAVTAADAVSEASSANPSPVFSRLSLDSTTPSLSGDMGQTSPDTSVDIHQPSKMAYSTSSPPRTSNIARRRSLKAQEKKHTSSSPTEFISPSSTASSSSNSRSRAKPSHLPRPRDNSLAPLPGTALSSAAFSLIPQLSNMNLNVNFSDLRGGMDKIITPQQQKRASKVFEGLWGAVASPSAVAAAAARKERKKIERDQVNLLDMEFDQDNGDNGEDDTIMPSRSSQFTVMVPDNQQKRNLKSSRTEEPELDLSITASPSGYLTASSATGFSTHPIKEEKESESEELSEDGWNW